MEMSIPGPFLVVVPLSTVPNWIREFRKWLPQVNALVYVGDSKSREARRFHASSTPVCGITYLLALASCGMPVMQPRHVFCNPRHSAASTILWCPASCL